MPRFEECPKCQKECKVCLNCEHYSQTAYHECKESESEWVKDKVAGNFCSYFKPIESISETELNNFSEESARKKLESLFKEPSQKEKLLSTDPKKALEDLFKK